MPCCSAPSAEPRWEQGGPRPEQGIMGLRKALDTYANLRPIRRWYAGAVSPLRPELIAGVDLLIVRELTGGLYFGERGRTPTGAFDTLSYSEHEIRRILRTGFRLARERRGHLTSVDKANVLESSRLWRELAEEIALDFPDVQLEHQLVDSMTMKLCERPAGFDVIVTENLFGDILGPRGLARRRHRAGAVRLAGRWRAGRVRADPRHGAGHRRQRPGEPRGCVPLGGDAAARARRARRRRPTSSRRSSPCSTAAR